MLGVPAQVGLDMWWVVGDCGHGDWIVVGRRKRKRMLKGGWIVVMDRCGRSRAYSACRRWRGTRAW
jgi:hypothetical protein